MTRAVNNVTKLAWFPAANNASTTAIACRIIAQRVFDVAAVEERTGNGKCELIPYWHVEADKYQIERIIPFYPFSRDRAKLSSLLKTLAIYRLAFGQPRQAELVEHLLTNIPDERISDIRNKLMIDLSPISYSTNKCLPAITADMNPSGDGNCEEGKRLA